MAVSYTPRLDWVALTKLKLSDQNKDILSLTIDPQYGNLP